MRYQSFEQIPIWKLSVEMAHEVYVLTSKKHFLHDFGLQNQLRRAAVSVSSNIVEGYERNNNNDFIRFLQIAKGSLGEVRSQLHIARLIEYISELEHAQIEDGLVNLSRQIGGLIVYLEQKRSEKEFIKTRR